MGSKRAEHQKNESPIITALNRKGYNLTKSEGKIRIKFTDGKSTYDAITSNTNIDIDYNICEKNKYDAVDRNGLMFEIKSSQRDPKVNQTLLLCELHKISDGYELDKKRIENSGLTIEEYNNQVVNLMKYLQKEGIQNVVNFDFLVIGNMENGKIFVIPKKDTLLECKISKGKLFRVIITCKILNVPQPCCNINHKIMPKINYPQMILNCLKSGISVDKLKEKKVLYEYDTLPKSIIKDKRYFMFPVNGEKLYAHTKESNSVKLRKIAQLSE
jgi:hypothetical protein